MNAAPHIDPFDPLTAAEKMADIPAPSDGWTPIIPVPAEAPKITKENIESKFPAGFAFTAAWRYTTEAGADLCVVIRADRPANGVEAARLFMPFTYCQGPNGRREWRPKGLPTPRPLLRLSQLARRSDAPVLVVEGEKTAHAAGEIFPDYVTTTSMSGAKSAAKADWTSLQGRRVTIWPDNDEAGRAYATEVAALLRDVGAESVAIVAVPQDWPVAWDLADELPKGVSTTTLSELLELSEQHQPDLGTWGNPDLSVLGTGRRAAPEFPVSLLNGWEQWVRKQAAACSAPVDYVATSLLVCAGAAIANVRWPLAGAIWSEPPVLWAGLPGDPSTGKSTTMGTALKLLSYAEEHIAAGYDEERRDYETARQTAKATREAWEAEVKASVKAGESPRQMPPEAEMPDMPPRPRIRIADATIEAIAKLSASLPRGLLLVRDELSGWFGAFDKYGGGGSDRAFSLEMYGGRSYVVDRVKNAEAIRIPHLSVGLLGGVQPDKLATILEGPDDGLVSRMLWAWPDGSPEFTLLRAECRDDNECAAFARLAQLSMGSDQFGNPEPKRLPLTTEAENYLEQYARALVERTRQAIGIFASTLGKARGHVLRLAAVLKHLWWCAQTSAREPQSISGDAVLAAIGIVDGYFLPMAERVLGDASIPRNDRLAMTLARMLHQGGRLSFNARELRHKGGALREAAAMDTACTVLMEAGIIRPAPGREGGTKGRQSKTYEVNSRLFRGRNP